ncbi:diguanylate cyclase [Pacificimonas sp. WHA3]|uniref:diguanylate cyclase n=1 Tax=Pacificimonas pallii TaxID=2827236 RepID=A0ABS6SAR0_9SPHN|nr:diguanylate cyclase [Pacificimonas pallii]MBV7255503.1 diguanylate cyclase [Pacificimonas pallii]
MKQPIQNRRGYSLDDASPTGGLSWLAQLRQVWSDSADRNLHDEVIAAQYGRVMACVPLLYGAVAAMAILAAYGSGGEFQWQHHIFLPVLFILVGIWRGGVWYRRRREKVRIAKMRKRLRETGLVALIVAAIGGVWTLNAFYDTVEARRVLAPIFVTLIALSGAICLNSLPRTAIGMTVVALAPSCVAMAFSDDVALKAVGFGTLVIAILLAGMISHHFATMVASIELRAELRELAETDALTRLSNRRALRSRFDADHAQRKGKAAYSLLMIDLNAFKAANDRHGHAAGDVVLQQTADRIRKLCEDAICVARLGGDEFAVLLARMTTKALNARMGALRAAIARPIPFEDNEIVIGAAIGMATGSDLSQLLRGADRALYAEKAARDRGDGTAAAA